MNVKIPKTNLQREYDRIVWMTIQNIVAKSKDTPHFYIKEINPKNKEHLFFLYSCLTLQGIYDTNANKIKRIYIHTSILNLIRINRIIGRRQYKILRCGRKKIKNGLDIDEILNFERAKAIQITYPDFSFGDIYDEFFNYRSI